MDAPEAIRHDFFFLILALPQRQVGILSCRQDYYPRLRDQGPVSVPFFGSPIIFILQKQYLIASFLRKSPFERISNADLYVIYPQSHDDILCPDKIIL
jgi:hypothetical protein